MSWLRRLRQRLAGDSRGAVVVEFALILIPMLTLIVGTLEIGYRAYAQSVLVGTLREAARLASTGTVTEEEIDAYVLGRLETIAAGEEGEEQVEIIKKSYATFTGVGLPEPITADTAPLGEYNAGDCYDDINDNGEWDEDQGADGLGGPDDVIYYEASVTFESLFPLSVNMLGLGDTATLSANTIVSNEPFSAAASVTAANLCS